MQEYYGDNVRWFIADVIDSTPPYGLEGRVRIRIHGIHSPSTRDTGQADLPWAQMVIPSTEGGVSGLGFNPKIESGSLVFGMFMDGKHSQVPLVIGTLPRTEYPSRVQQRIEFESVVERANPIEDFYNQAVVAIEENFADAASIDYDLGWFTRETERRKAIAVKFFLSNGYTMKQACSLSAGLHITSSMNPEYSNPETLAYGIGGWTGQRFKSLKTFSQRWNQFTTQLAFVLYELNTTQVEANSRLLRIDSLDPSKKNCQTIVARDYLKRKTQEKILPVINTAVDIHDELVG